jgi:hypothetical protein
VSAVPCGTLLAQRPAAEILEERLALAVAEFNAPLAIPEQRVALREKIARLRALLTGKGGE